MIASSLRHSIHTLRRRTSSSVSLAINDLFLLLAWTFLPLENAQWHAVMSRRAVLFPQIDFKRLKPLDGLRMFVQSVYLLFFYITDEPLVRSRLDQDHAAHDNLLRRAGEALRNAGLSLRGFIAAKGEALTGALTSRIASWHQTRTQTAQNKSFRSEWIAAAFFTLLAATLGWLCITQPLDLWNQTIFLMATVSIALFVRHIRSHFTFLLLIVLSTLVSARYMWWRWTQTLNLDSTAGTVCSILLVLAETYAFVVMLLGYFQTFWVLDRPPVPMPAKLSAWPHVDICIPTYNEPLEIVKTTVYGALSMDWPTDKLHIWILDDGSRPEFRAFAEASGVGYIEREKHDHAKAGNINHALGLIHGEFVAIFDCDHVPVRSFLQMTVGWLVRDPKIALVQTPHHFYSQDPFERNLGLSSAVPVENALFHDFIQKGNDTWNATMFCGSCAVIRRSALDEIGGIAVETVTEDAHTSLRLNRRGWSSAFIGIPLAAGLSTETLAAHIGQRIRWARGMIQIFRIDNPLLGRGLSFGQRMCFLNAMIHFLHGLPRIIFLLAPLPYLFFHVYVIEASAAAIFVYVLPHMIHSIITSSIIERGHRSPFLGAVYEAVLSWYILLPTTVALFAPNYGKFNVTSKGGTVKENYVDWNIIKPYCILIALNAAGFIFGSWQLLRTPHPEYLTLAINGAWILYNLMILGVTVSVAVETVQERKFPRVRVNTPAVLKRADGSLFDAELTDYSQKGVSLKLHDEAVDQFFTGNAVELILENDGLTYAFPAVVRRAREARLGLELTELSPEAERAFIAATFCRADAWVQPKTAAPGFLDGTHALLSFACRGYSALWQYAPPALRRIARPPLKLAQWILSFAPRRRPAAPSLILGVGRGSSNPGMLI